MTPAQTDMPAHPYTGALSSLRDEFDWYCFVTGGALRDYRLMASIPSGSAPHGRREVLVVPRTAAHRRVPARNVFLLTCGSGQRPKTYDAIILSQRDPQRQ